MGVRRVCMHACKQNEGSVGACSLRKFLEIRCSEIASEAINFALHVHIYAFTKTSNFYERRYYVGQNSRWGDK